MTLPVESARKCVNGEASIRRTMVKPRCLTYQSATSAGRAYMYATCSIFMGDVVPPATTFRQRRTNNGSLVAVASRRVSRRLIHGKSSLYFGSGRAFSCALEDGHDV